MDTITFCLRTLGCKVNQYESQALREAWTEQGLSQVGEPSDAKVVVFNSCAVTSKAVQDLRTQVRQAHKANPDAEIVITGCAAQVLAQELAELPGVGAVVPQQAKAGLLEGPFGNLPGELQDAPAFPPFAVSEYPRARAICKIQDGCSHGCTYCIVPLTRGGSVSRPPAEVLAEIRRLWAVGFREVTLAGINLRHYSHAHGDGRLDMWGLLAYLEAELAGEWAGRARLRLSSLDPAQLTPRGLEVLAASRLVCPHLHVALQSLCPTVLARMARDHTDPKTVVQFVSALKSVWPVFGLGADFVAGFPGETEAEAAETLKRAAGLPLTYAHVFPYSARPGTPAAAMAPQVDKAEKARRAKELRDMAQAKKEAFARTVAEQELLQVVLEQDNPWRGTCQYYVDCQFAAAPDGARVRQLVAAKPVGVDERGMVVVTRDGQPYSPHASGEDT